MVFFHFVIYFYLEISPENLPPPEPIPVDILPDNMALEEIGNVASVVDNVVVVQGKKNAIALDIGSVLWWYNRIPLGRVDDVFGPVFAPLYSVRFIDVEEAAKYKEKVSHKIYYSRAFALFVLPAQLKDKGSDASSKNDEEPAEEELDFSDDEKEAEHKRKLKLKKAQNAAQSNNLPLSSNKHNQPIKGINNRPNKMNQLSSIQTAASQINSNIMLPNESIGSSIINPYPHLANDFKNPKPNLYAEFIPNIPNAHDISNGNQLNALNLLNNYEDDN